MYSEELLNYVSYTEKFFLVSALMIHHDFLFPYLKLIIFLSLIDGFVLEFNLSSSSLVTSNLKFLISATDRQILVN